MARRGYLLVALGRVGFEVDLHLKAVVQVQLEGSFALNLCRGTLFLVSRSLGVGLT